MTLPAAPVAGLDRRIEMNWDAIGAVAEGLGATGVIVTLVYLVRQLRTNNLLLRSESNRYATQATHDDARTALGLIDEMDEIASFTADAAYDTLAIYDAAAARGAEVIVPPRIPATRSTRSCARDRTVRRLKKVGRRQWKKESGYHQQARAENTFLRYKSMIGDRLRARHPESQKAEALIACNILNRMFELGKPKSFAVK
jgi:hypothetical protein